MATARQLLVTAGARLRAAGVASPEVDAALLLCAVTGRPRLELVLLGDIPDEQSARFTELVERRAAREPLQHLTGSAPFRYLELQVGPGVFVPRPETELLVDAVLDFAREESVRALVDLCTGSGALALSLAGELPGARVWAVELDAAAAAWAQRNLTQSGIQDVELVVADARTVTGTALAHLVGSCDVVVTNPPYIPDDAVPRDPEVARHDPPLALYGGPDGLAVMRELAAQAAILLRPGGLFVAEHADCQGEPGGVPGLLRAAGWRQVSDHHDLTGVPRFTTARTPAPGEGT